MSANYPPLNSTGKLLGMLHRMGVVQIHCQTVTTKVANHVPAVITSLQRHAKLVAENEDFVVYMYIK